MDKIRCLLIAFFVLSLTAVQANDNFWQRYPSPVPGGVVFIPLDNKDLSQTPQVFYKGKQALVMKNVDHWVAVLGVSLKAKAGLHTLVDKKNKRSYNFDVQEKEYESQYITLKNKRQVNPNKQDMVRINKETKIIKKSLATPWRNNNATLSLPLLQPVAGEISSPYGLKRFFNKQARKPHRGIDIAADKGDPIIAPTSGTVINTGHYFFNGKTVFLDHGQALITMYCHMDKIDVKVGQQVAQGEKIGEIGMTGRVTGPHLHWGVRLNQQWIDPMLVLQ